MNTATLTGYQANANQLKMERKMDSGEYNENLRDDDDDGNEDVTKFSHLIRKNNTSARAACPTGVFSFIFMHLFDVLFDVKIPNFEVP